MYKIGKRTIAAFSLLAIIIAVSSFCLACGNGRVAPIVDGGVAPANSVAAVAAGDNEFNDLWTGEVTAGSYSSTVTIDLDPEDPYLEYGEPRGCYLSLDEPVRKGDNSMQYSLIEPSGGICDGFLYGKLIVTIEPDGKSLSYQIKVDKQILESGSLSRSDN